MHALRLHARASPRAARFMVNRDIRIRHDMIRALDSRAEAIVVR